ncbi:uncharacterized protein LOC123511960 [Portunus trituberculatus]|uniref:uncharacterized protein LOC123511960 n=1 Tax=Portunus trituberculatus TaxID=210409 RepID=UPI001E1CED56|nr:uncharacterized protein LOC123511960 [Portunus trituberculatus]
MLVITFLVWLIFLASHSQHSGAQLPYSSEITKAEALGAVQAVISSSHQQECPVILLWNHPGQITFSFLKDLSKVVALWGVTVFQVAAHSVINNETQINLETMVGNVRLVGWEAWHCLVVVVVSDDPAFLAAFAHLSLKRHALRWSTRILILTRLPLSRLGGLHDLLSNRNAMLLLIRDDEKEIRNVDVYVAAPYSTPTTQPRRLVTWTPNTTWTRASYVQFFPEKFFVFSSAPRLTLVIEQMAHDFISWVEDPEAPEKRRLAYTGHIDNTVKYFAKAMNFTYRYVLSPDRTFGTKLPDGSWTGMMGMVVRETVDFGAVPFMISPVRAEAGDYTSAIWTGNMKIVSGLSGLQINPWGFLLPLTPLVWASTLAALLGVLTVLLFLTSCLSRKTKSCGGWSANTSSSVRVLLQQGEA